MRFNKFLGEVQKQVPHLKLTEKDKWNVHELFLIWKDSNEFNRLTIHERVTGVPLRSKQLAIIKHVASIIEEHSEPTSKRKQESLIDKILNLFKPEK